jgi:hypothetical protein
MRWMMIGLLVSVGGLVLAASGAACHIWFQRTRLRHLPPKQETDLES